jgi:hypothetical protein
MVKLPDTLSERISALADDADQLHSLIRNLRKEVDKMDGIESIPSLADVPGELLNAENFADKMYEFLESAETCAKKGGA